MPHPHPLPNCAVDQHLLYEDAGNAAGDLPEDSPGAVVNRIWCVWGLDETTAAR